jgi:hypothetical protein
VIQTPTSGREGQLCGIAVTEYGGAGTDAAAVELASVGVHARRRA